MKIEIHPGKRFGSIVVPTSKSDAQRTLIAAALSNGTSTIKNSGTSDDERAVIQALKTLGVSVNQINTTTLQIEGQTFPKKAAVSVGESGLAARLLIGVLSCIGGEFEVYGTGTLLKRPLSLYRSFFVDSGIGFQSNDDYLPIHLTGKVNLENLVFDGSQSSQYISGFLMGLPFLSETTSLIVENLVSKPYVDMTLSTMRAFGVAIENHDYKNFKLNNKSSYKATEYTIECDWSAASCWLVAAALGADIQLKGLSMVSKQADIQILRALERANCKLLSTDECIEIDGSTRVPFEFDATDCPDLFPALATLASFTSGVSTIKGVNRLATKESNRGEVLQAEYTKLGVHIEIQDDWMLIHGQSNVNGGKVSSHHDHRIAMCFAIAGMFSSDPITIEHAEAVSKSYPEFWEHFNHLKIKM